MLAQNPNYMCEIFGGEPYVSIMAPIPEEVAINLSSAWENRMPASFKELSDNIGGLTGAGLSAGMNYYGYNKVLQSFTHQMWISSTPIELSLIMLFDAYNDAASDVLLPMAQLQQLVAPYRQSADSDLLHPPGPSPQDPQTGKISVRVGRFIFIPSVLVVDVNNTFETRLTADGIPIAGQSEITIRSIVTPARDDLALMYGLG
jgi:hypothetical protein